MSTKNQHVKSECLWVSRGQNIVVELICVGEVAINKKCKFIQFVAIF
jgi:hypothetical protein